jgi:hypothetical protein
VSAHVTTESLSAYLDRELPGNRVREVERHLEDCPRCRADLESLSRVIRRLQAVQRVAPPPLLAGDVARRVALDGRPRSLVERIESRLSGQPFQSNIINTFALVMALAAILYLFAFSLDLIERKQIPVRVVSPEASAEFFRQHEIAIGMRSEVADRVFHREGDLWREDGAAGEPDAELAASSPEGLAVQERNPELGVLLGQGEAVILRDGDRIVKILVE